MGTKVVSPSRLSFVNLDTIVVNLGQFGSRMGLLLSFLNFSLIHFTMDFKYFEQGQDFSLVRAFYLSICINPKIYLWKCNWAIWLWVLSVSVPIWLPTFWITEKSLMLSSHAPCFFSLSVLLSTCLPRQQLYIPGKLQVFQ